VVDADFDEEEQPDEDVHDADAEDDKPQRKRAAAAQTKAYREPSSRAKKARLQAVATGSNGTEIVARQSPTGASKPPAPLVYEGPRVRRSTARKSTESSELRKRASEEAARLAAKLKRPTVDKARTRLTQAQLLAEAVRTEVENVQSLNRLEQLEEEKKAESMTPKAPFTGQMVRYYSRVGVPKTITFLNSIAFPPLFNQPKPKKRVSTQEKLEQLRQEAGDDSTVEGSESDEEDDNSVDERGSSITSRRAAKKAAGRVRSASANNVA
jgi:vacuolar protein sorting-associated protein 72